MILIYGTKNNPTSNYRFNFQVKSFNQYDYYISNPEKMKIIYNKNKISEYFASKFMMQENNLFFSKEEIKKIDKVFTIDQNLMTNIGFKNFIESFDEKKNNKINFKIDKFIKSNKFRLDKENEEFFKKN